MRVHPLKLVLNFTVLSILLCGCQTTTSSEMQRSKHKPKIQYVQTENIQWNDTDEEDQELADEV